ncbi:hypothetical protein ACQZV8_20875, partial [Magnetococcales bacterium HHB-1]
MKQNNKTSVDGKWTWFAGAVVFILGLSLSFGVYLLMLDRIKAARKMAFDYNILDRFQVMRHGIFLGIEGVNDLATMAERIDHLDVEVLQRYSESLLDHQQGAAFFSWVSEEEVVSKGRLALPVQ